jgi:hypothetical protein
VRAVGESFRAYGQAASSGETRRAAATLATLRRAAAKAAQQHGDEMLLRLRAVQANLFLRALARWEAIGEFTLELSELSGSLIQEAEAIGWVQPPHRLVLTTAERRTLFRIRWADLAGLKDRHPYSPTLNEWRTYYRFLLEHPSAAANHDIARARTRKQLQVIDALAKRDPQYPTLYAKGILLYRLGAFSDAALAFDLYLQQSADGSWDLRARNHLVAALARVRESGQL